jgi:hypothetical protein
VKFDDKEKLEEMQTKFQYLIVKESPIPLHVLYNDSINKLKLDEKEGNKEPKPLTFSIKNPNSKNKTIRFEILGENA